MDEEACDFRYQDPRDQGLPSAPREMIEEGDVVKKVGPCNEGNYCYRKDEKAITMCDLTYYYRGKSE